jgi:hypothetical protein
MRFLLFHLYNSGLNSVRINGFNIRPYDHTGTKIDRLEYHPNPDEVILPGLAAGVGSGQDVRVEGVLSP